MTNERFVGILVGVGCVVVASYSIWGPMEALFAFGIMLFIGGKGE